MVYGFITVSQGFDIEDKLKLVLFFSNTKPVTYVTLKINNKNLDEKYQFEKFLKKHKIQYKVSKAKGFDEIKKIKRNAIVWETKGIWFGYDLFHTKNQLNSFAKYVKFMKQEKFLKADLEGGKLYGYPLCCIKQFTKERSRSYIKKQYSYFEYYQKIRTNDKKFPFLFANVCKKTCSKAIKLNKLYRTTIKKHSPKLYEHFTKKQIIKTKFIVEGFSDILKNNKSIWKTKDGFDYNLLSKKPIKLESEGNKKHFVFFVFLTKAFYAKGQILKIKNIFQYGVASIEVLKVKKSVIKNLHHERKFPLIARKH